MNHYLKSFLPYLILLLLLVFFFNCRSFSRNAVTVDVDEYVYLKFTQDWVAGGRPYVDTWDIKGPVLFMLFYPAVYFFDNDTVAIRTYFDIFHLISILAVFVLSKLYFNNYSALVATIVYGSVINIMLRSGQAMNAEIVLLLPVILCYYCFEKYQRTKNRSYLLAIGIITSLAFFIKHIAILLIFPIFIFNFFVNKKISQKIKTNLDFAIGFALGSIIIFAVMFYHSALNDFLYTYFYVDLQRGGFLTTTAAIQNFRKILKHFLTKETAFCLLTIFCYGYFTLKHVLNFSKIWLTSLLLFFSLLTIYILQFGFEHYLLVLSLPLAIIFASTYYYLTNKAIKAAFTFTLIISILIPNYSFIESCLTPALRRKASSNVINTVNYLKEHVRTSQKILVLGNPAIYFLSKLKSVNKYFFYLHYAPIWQELLMEGRSPAQVLRFNLPDKVILYDYVIKETSKQRVSTDINELLDFVNQNYTVSKVFNGISVMNLDKQKKDREKKSESNPVK